MKCPKDGHQLLPHEGNSHASKCGHCSGAFVHSQELIDLIRSQGVDAKKIEPNRVLSALCPQCYGQMACWIAYVTEVEICSVCSAVWFDAGEVEKIDQSSNSTQKVQYLPSEPSLDDFGIIQALLRFSRVF